MVAQEVVFVPVVHCSLQEEPAYAEMSHLLEAAVGGVDAAADDAKTLPFHLLGEKVVLGKENLLVKSAEFAEFFQIEQHEHSCREGMMEAREILEEIIACVEKLVDPTASQAQDVCGDALKPLALGEFDGTANDGRVREFNVGIEKENVGAVGMGGAQVAADGGHSAADHADVQAVAETENNFWSAVCRTGISDQYSGTRHLRVVLIRQRDQQTGNQLRLVLGWNHDRQLAGGIRAR